MSIIPQPQEKTKLQRLVEDTNFEYVSKCKDLGTKDVYQIEINGKPIRLKRKRLSTKAYIGLERQKQEIEKQNREERDVLKIADNTAKLYYAIASTYLTAEDTGKPITKEQFENCPWEEIREIIDSCTLRTSMGIPF